jgi:exopolysaccharide biosynthesis polyprenyl glycosylphosphotransferase
MGKKNTTKNQTFDKMSFYSQDVFSALLSMERKRCERSGSRFGLALLDVSFLSKVDRLCETLCGQLRETDIAGWYRDTAVIGLIFTSLNGTEIPITRSALQSKIDETMRIVLPPDELKKVTVAMFIFPEDVNEELYPELETENNKTIYRTIKRVIDVTGSLSALSLLLPLFLAIAVLVKHSSPGPVLFRQKRLGRMGKQFDFLKFRTMYADNDPRIHQEYVEKLIKGEHHGETVFKIRNDPRVTPLGRWLRRTSLDELPQFINVLKGEMSLVGPRPPIPYEMENYSCWHRRRVLEARPGLTGLWQVNGRSSMTFDEMVRLDIRYIMEQSLWLDLKILFQTPRAVISAAGAY